MSSQSLMLRSLPQLARLGALLACLLSAPVSFGEDEVPAGKAGSEAAPAASEESEARPAPAPESEAEPAPTPPPAEEEEEKRASSQGELAIPGPPSAGVEEIVITGELVEGMVQDKTASVIGFDQNVLKLEGIKDIRDLSNFTPTLEIKSAFAASNPTIFIRGVGLDDFNANAASAVAIYQDGVYMQSPVGQLFQFFDTENVQVLRGPQPSLYRNASAGAILVESHKPTEELNGYLTATYGNYNLIQTEGAVGGPIIPGWLSGRLSGSWETRDGITKNGCGSTAKLPPKDLDIPVQCDQLRGSEEANNLERVVVPGLSDWTNNLDDYAGRGQLLFKLPVGEDEMEWLLNVHGGQNYSRALQFQHRGVKFLPVCDANNPPPDCVPSPTDNIPGEIGPDVPDSTGYADPKKSPFKGDYNIDGPENISLVGTSLTGSWSVGGYELGSLTAFEWHDRFTHENSDASPNFALETQYKDHAWQLSQQFDLKGDWAESDTGSGNWILGVYYLQEDLDVNNFYDVQQGSVLDQTYTQKTRNFAAFGQSEYHLEPGCAPISCNFTLTTGLRYNLEFKDFSTLVCPARISDCGPESANALSGSNNDLWDGLGGEISLAWNFNEDSSLYAKFSQGWKGGHFNGGAVTQYDVISGVKPEIVDSYEAGLRSFWFDDRLMLNTTGFYYDYQNLQVFELEQTPGGFPIPKLVNSKAATVYGIELDLGAQPLSGMNVTYNFAWVESDYTDFEVTLPEKFRPERPPGGGPRPPQIVRKTYVYSGNPLIASPRFSMTGSVEYAVPLPWTPYGLNLGTLSPRFSFSWKSDVYFDSCSGKGDRCTFPKGTFGQPAFWVFNGALSWRSDDEKLEISGWVHNFLDEKYKTQNFDLSTEFGIIEDVYADPRMFGVTATYNF